jgi:hypothetical protein
MAPARMDRHNYMDVVTQWMQGVHGKSNITEQRVIQLHNSITKNKCCSVQRDQNITKKTSDYQEFFTQLLGFSLNIFKQGCLIGKGYPCALSLASYLINLESSKEKRAA